MLPNSMETANGYSRGQGMLMAFFGLAMLILVFGVMVLISPPEPRKVKEVTASSAPAGQALFETNCNNNGGTITYNLDGNTVDRTMTMLITCKLPEKPYGHEKPQD